MDGQETKKQYSNGQQNTQNRWTDRGKKPVLVPSQHSSLHIHTWTVNTQTDIFKCSWFFTHDLITSIKKSAFFCPHHLSKSTKTHQPQTLTHQPQTLTLQPQLLTLQPQTLTLQPQTLTLQPQMSTLQPQTSTLQPQMLTLQPQTSTL